MGLQQKLAEINSDMLSRVPRRHSTSPISSSVLAVVRNASFPPDEDGSTFEAPAERICESSMMNQADQLQESVVSSSPMMFSLHSAVNYMGNEHAVTCTVAHRLSRRAGVLESESVLEPELKLQPEIDGDIKAFIIRMRQSTLQACQWKSNRSPSPIMDEDTEDSIASRVSTRQLTCNPTGYVAPLSDDDFEFKEPPLPMEQASTVYPPPLSESEVTSQLPETQERTPTLLRNLSSGPIFRKTATFQLSRRVPSPKPMLCKGMTLCLTRNLFSSGSLPSPEEIGRGMDTHQDAEKMMELTALPSSPSMQAEVPPIPIRIANTYSTDKIFNVRPYRNLFLLAPRVDETSPRNATCSLNIQQQTIAPTSWELNLRKQSAQPEQIKPPELVSSYSSYTSPMGEDFGDIT